MKYNEKSKTLETLNHDVNRIRQEFGKGMYIDEIGQKLGMSEEYARLLLYFGIMT